MTNSNQLRLGGISLKWKLALWSALFISVLFLMFNAVQMLVIQRWILHQETEQIRGNMQQIAAYFRDSGKLDKDDIADSASYLQALNVEHQFIRILDAQGRPVLTVANSLRTNWVQPRTAASTTLDILKHDQDHLLVIRAPFPGNEFHGTIEIARNLEMIDQLMKKITMVLFAGGLAALVLSSAAGMWVAGSMLKPLQSLRETFRAIQRRGLHERAAVPPGQDEIAELTVMFNEMMEEVEASFLRQRRFVEDASHELRTPLAILEGHLSILNRWGKQDPEVLDESLGITADEVRRLIRLVNELLQLTRADAGGEEKPAEILHPAEQTESLIKRIRPLYVDAEFSLDLEEVQPLAVRMDPAHWEQLLLILIDNAVKYARGKPSIEIVGRAENDHVAFSVRDCGIGIPAEDLPHVFERFYRVDKARSRESGGSGLGLSIAQSLVARYGGDIGVESGEGEGTTVRFRFPIGG